MRALVEGGADVRAVDEQGLSALLNAVKVGGLSSIFRAAASLTSHINLNYLSQDAIPGDAGKSIGERFAKRGFLFANRAR